MSPSRLEFAAIRAFANVAGTLPWGAGHYRLASRYAARARWAPGSDFLQRMHSGTQMSLDLGDRAQAVAFLVRDYSPQHIRFFASRLPDNGIFFDVGAHVGLISFAVLARRPDVEVHAFEPNPRNAAAWRRNRRLNPGGSARLTEAGLSDHTGHMSFGVVSDSGSGELGHHDGTLVPVTTLDTYCAAHGIDRIDVLKIDVQGHEVAVLRGAARLLAREAIMTIVCEIDVCGPEAISRVLRPYGFRPMEIPEIGIRGILSNWISKRAPDDLAFER